ncbi:MAG: hypothetical protein R3E01_31010 [Pirellulaceae bacterium]
MKTVSYCASVALCGFLAIASGCSTRGGLFAGGPGGYGPQRDVMLAQATCADGSCGGGSYADYGAVDYGYGGDYGGGCSDYGCTGYASAPIGGGVYPGGMMGCAGASCDGRCGGKCGMAARNLGALANNTAHLAVAAPVAAVGAAGFAAKAATNTACGVTALAAGTAANAVGAAAMAPTAFPGMMADFRQRTHQNCANGICGRPPGPSSGAVTYPYYTTRGPRDFLMSNPGSIGP